MKKNLLLMLVTCLFLVACGSDSSPTTETPSQPPASPTAKSVPEDIPTEVPVSATEVPTIEASPENETIVETDTETVTSDPSKIVGEMARDYIIALSEKIGTRIAGSSEETAAAQYIASEFESFGYAVDFQEFTENLPNGNGEVTSANIVAIKEGLSDANIIIGAHYDSVSDGQGADDNASGVAVMLEVAQMLQNVDTPYTITFIAFGAEEVRFVGSTFYVSQMSEKEMANVIVMINLDSVIAGDNAYVYGDGDAGGEIRDWLVKWGETEGLPLQTQTGENPSYPAGTTGDWSDHVPFKQAGIPYVYFESTNWLLGDMDGYTQVDLGYGRNGEIWHTEFDNLEYIETTFPDRVDERLSLFVSALHKISTEYEITD